MWIHFQEFSHDFTTFFIALNSHMNSWLWNHTLLWTHQHKFRNEFIQMNSDIWFHDILHDHEFIYEFILWIHIRFHDHEFIWDISWLGPMNSYMNSFIWRTLWNHTWNHVYQGSRWLVWVPAWGPKARVVQLHCKFNKFKLATLLKFKY